VSEITPNSPDQSSPDLSVDRYKQERNIEVEQRSNWLSRYSYLEKLLFRGFLTCNSTINNIPIVFKTVNNLEFDRIKLYIGRRDDIMTHQLYFIAHSIFLLDDVNVLLDRDRNLPYIIKSLKKLPSNLLSQIAEHLTILNNLSISSGALIEAYCYEEVSRQNWMVFKGQVLNDSKMTGIGGTENIGLNTYQRMWLSLNNLEDVKITREIAWDYAKFIGSCSNPKGVRTIESQDKARRNKENDEREKIRTGGSLSESSVKIQASSIEELMGELEHSLKGEKDWHDIVVEKHENKLVSEHNLQKEGYLNIMSNVPMDVSLGISSLEEKKVFSLEEIQESLDRRRRGIIDSPSMQRLSDINSEFKSKKGSNLLIKSDIIGEFEVGTPDIGDNDAQKS